MSEDGKFFLFIFLMIIIIIPINFVSADLFLGYTCHNYGSNTHRQVKYSYGAMTCYVKMPNGWFTYGQITQNSLSKG